MKRILAVDDYPAYTDCAAMRQMLLSGLPRYVAHFY